VGGLDLAPGRWDRREHLAEDPLRVGPDGRLHGPFHDAVLMVDGPAAASIAELARERWRRATGRRIPAVTVGHDPWPPGAAPWFEGVDVGIARTEPAWNGYAAAAEVEALYLAAIRSAKRHIYVENQYLTATRVAEALAERLEEPDGPEVLIVTTDRCEGFFETAVMDVGRARFLRRLNRADGHLRLRVLHPVRLLPKPTSINLHAKLMVVDDRLVCIGSANLANRSMGLDTESVLAIDATGGPDDRDDTARAIAAFRDDLLAEHMEVAPAEVAATLAETGSLLATLDRHNGGGRRLETLVLALPELMTEVAAEPARLADPPEPLQPERVGDYLLPPAKRRRLSGPLLRLGLLLLALVALAAAWRFGPLGEWVRVEEVLGAIWAYTDSPPVGLGLVLAVFTVGGLLMVPLTLMIATTAVVFGGLQAFCYALAGAMLSAAVSFALGRLLGRDALRRFAGRRVNAVSRRLAERGVVAMTVLRLLPVAPFTIVNLAAGASEVRARDFLLGSLLGLMPGVAAMAGLGEGLQRALRDPRPANFLLLGAIALGVFGLALLLYRWSRARARR
ncbi:MAG TPA: VTT domain-containing protein, partial [Geminicoccaceae bacterium]|nr:VTT domain-containing protein [Geminicoccaceae bacterium]